MGHDGEGWMSGFARHRRSGRMMATFTGFEADLLRSLESQLVELLRDQIGETRGTDPLERLLDFSGPTAEPEDPVLRRLLPSAYPDDEVAAAEFRRFTEGALRDGKVRAATTVISDLEEAGLRPVSADPAVTVDVELDEAGADLWMRAFTDIRLALATRLGIEESDDETWQTLAEDDPRHQTYNIYAWLGYLQETLVAAHGR
jgi:hypothetical protein